MTRVKSTPMAETSVALTAAALRTSEAAAYLGVQPATMEQWRWNGRGPRFAKIGRCVRYRRSDLDAFLEQRVFRSTTEAQQTAA